MPLQRAQQRLRRLRQLQMTGMNHPDTLLNLRVIQRQAYGAQRLHLRLAERRNGAAARPLATILPTVTS